VRKNHNNVALSGSIPLQPALFEFSLNFTFHSLIGCHLRKMRRVWVNSSSIASIGYEAAMCELEIEFRESGDVYRYFDVPEESMLPFSLPTQRGPISIRCSRSETIGIVW
jgi:hypothetical protein